ncbi:condensin complex subunit 1-like [Musca autumnalis]|uniref:condensin complex subunit 1-like n=1 Tax=Musca autumnalis TaxID=221902 RepID=UPI003CF66355
MDFQFNLPLTTGDLLDSSGDNYYVKQLYSPTEIPDKLRVCKQMLHQGDPFYIFDHFDTYYAVIENKNTDSTAMTNLMRSFDLLYLTVDKLGNRLAPFLALSEPPTNQERNSHLNLTKMCMFLLVNVVRKIDANILRLQQQQQQNQQKKRGKNADTVEQYPAWENKRGKNRLIQLIISPADRI